MFAWEGKHANQLLTPFGTFRPPDVTRRQVVDFFEESV